MLIKDQMGPRRRKYEAFGPTQEGNARRLVQEQHLTLENYDGSLSTNESKIRNKDDDKTLGILKKTAEP